VSAFVQAHSEPFDASNLLAQLSTHPMSHTVYFMAFNKFPIALGILFISFPGPLWGLLFARITCSLTTPSFQALLPVAPTLIWTSLCSLSIKDILVGCITFSPANSTDDESCIMSGVVTTFHLRITFQCHGNIAFVIDSDSNVCVSEDLFVLI
jgi:hypothetical protein